MIGLKAIELVIGNCCEDHECRNTDLAIELIIGDRSEDHECRNTDLAIELTIGDHSEEKIVFIVFELSVVAYIFAH